MHCPGRAMQHCFRAWRNRTVSHSKHSTGQCSIATCSCSDTPPSVNSSPFFISRVCGSIDPNVSVPMMASVLRSHTKTGNSDRRPKNDTMQDEHPEIVIGDPLAPRSLLSVGRNTPTGAPALSSVW